MKRQTRMLRLVYQPRSDSDSLHAARVAGMQDLPSALMRSITWDQGTEMARHLATADTLDAPVYFGDSPIILAPSNAAATRTRTACCATPSPNGVTLIDHLPGHLLAVESEVNHRPVLSFKIGALLTYSLHC